jgi:hypothetical protein
MAAWCVCEAVSGQHTNLNVLVKSLLLLARSLLRLDNARSIVIVSIQLRSSRCSTACQQNGGTERLHDGCHTRMYPLC